MQMQVKSIVVGDRRRDGVGDITELAESIRKHGLMHPIVVTASGELVAGERRLRAHQHLGRTWIDVTQLGELSDDQLRDMELDENIHRLNLTQAERDRIMVQRIERAKAEAVEESSEFRSNVDRNSEGRPSQPASQRDLARRTNTPKTTIQRATAYAAAIAAYPVLDGWPKTPAIEARRVLDALEITRRIEVLGLLTESGLVGMPGLDYINANSRGRITAIHPGVPVSTPPALNAPAERVADRKEGLRSAALKDAHKHVLLAAREFDDERGDRLRSIANEIHEMIGTVGRA